jgi:hypothetical protein
MKRMTELGLMAVCAGYSLYGNLRGAKDGDSTMEYHLMKV